MRIGFGLAIILFPVMCFLGLVIGTPIAIAADAFPGSAELGAAQGELNKLRAIGPRNQLDTATQKLIDEALAKRNAELDKRNAEWKSKDSVSMLKAQAETCSTVRQGLSEGKRAGEYFDNLRYAGFSTEESLDVVLQIDSQTPQVGKSVRVAFCILGLPTDRIRGQSQNSETVMFVYPKMFVHAEHGIVTSWTDR